MVFYANYLRFFERARTEWLRSRGVDQSEFAERTGVVFAVVTAEVEYRNPARLDDVIVVSAVPERGGRSSVVFQQEIRRDGPEGELLCRARIRAAALTRDGFRPTRIPEGVFGEDPT